MLVGLRLTRVIATTQRLVANPPSASNAQRQRVQHTIASEQPYPLPVGRCGHLANLRDPSRAVTVADDVNDEIDGGGQLLADCIVRQRNIAHQDHGLEPPERIGG